MSNTVLKIVLALVALSLPATAFARGTSAGMASRAAIIGSAQMLDQSQKINAPAVAPIPPPRITIPKIPQFK
jgi:hypothetical protein